MLEEDNIIDLAREACKAWMEDAACETEVVIQMAKLYTAIKSYDGRCCKEERNGWCFAHDFQP